jgi:PLP dependent protein
MTEIGENLHRVQARISAACERSGRSEDSVQLIAVSKTFPAEWIRQAADCGHRVFGESRLQEAEPKVASLPSNLIWHFIGRLQRNKIRRILPLFPVVHAVDSLRLAQYMDGIALEEGLFPQVFLQVDIANEESKAGFASDVLIQELDSLMGLKRLEVIGLMCIPPAVEDPELSRPWFARLREMRDEIQTRVGVPLPHLSMGMSGDFEVAVEEGATHVRVGSSIFGKRSYRVDGELG